MSRTTTTLLVAFLLSLAGHTGLLWLWTIDRIHKRADAKPFQIQVVIEPPKREAPVSKAPPKPTPKATTPFKPRTSDTSNHGALAAASSVQPPAQDPVSIPAPLAPTAQEWEQAATYKLRNSKRYRYNWGQLVRSLMGPAVAGPDQGMARFRIEIAPDGTLASIQELWSTSEAVSRRARQAMQALPPLPPTPTGKPLVFERTISLQPYETGWPPSYKLDCLPAPPAFQNPFKWDGISAQTTTYAPHTGAPVSDDDVAAKDCRTDSTADTIEEEETQLKRQMEVGRWGR